MKIPDSINNAENNSDIDLVKIFDEEVTYKKIRPVKLGETVIAGTDQSLSSIIGPCASVILCGIDKNENVWMGMNHMLQSRVGNRDMALSCVAEIRNGLIEKGCGNIQCLGLFGRQL